MRLNDPVSHLPGGTTSCAPPSDATWLRLRMAALNAAVFKVVPSPTAPKSDSNAVCFRQFIAEYCTGYCAKLRHTIPSIKLTRNRNFPIACKNEKSIKKEELETELYGLILNCENCDENIVGIGEIYISRIKCNRFIESNCNCSKSLQIQRIKT